MTREAAMTTAIKLGDITIHRIVEQEAPIFARSSSSRP